MIPFFQGKKICNKDIINLRVLNKNRGMNNLKEKCVVRYSSRPLEKPEAPPHPFSSPLLNSLL